MPADRCRNGQSCRIRPFCFDKATAVFARSNTGFEILAQALNATFRMRRMTI